MLKHQKAFTLVELMVTLLVISITLALAIPNFKTQMLNNRSQTLGEEFAAALTYARTEAVKRSTRVSLCLSSNGTSCATAGDWRIGFMVFIDPATSDTDTATPAPAPAAILKVWPQQDANAQLLVKKNGSNIQFIRFTGLGTLARLDTYPIVITSKLTGCKSNSASQIDISLSGQVRFKKIDC